MKHFFTCLLLLYFTVLKAQDRIELNNQDGIYVSYVAKKIGGNDKKDKYVATITIENKNEYDMYYAVSFTLNPNGLEVKGQTGFAEVNVRNSTGLLRTGLFGATLNLSGVETKFKTTDRKNLYVLAKGQILSNDLEFNVPKGDAPVLTNTFSKMFQRLSYFDLFVNDGIINGYWTSNCGNIQMNLVYQKNVTGESFIQQSVIGNQNMWKSVNDFSFEKTTDRNTTITYNKIDQTFLYKNSDGVLCTWIKK